MTKKLKIVMAQLNLHVGDIEGNVKKHIHAAEIARNQHGADLIVFPELSVCGYPPEDLLLRPAFIDAAMKATEQLITEIKDIHILFGHPYPGKRGLLNSCTLAYNATILGHYAKQYLPNYGVFDEDRYFVADTEPCVVTIHGIPIGLIICEDIWFPEPIRQATEKGAKIILCPNASPFETTKHEDRVALLTKRAKQSNTHIIYVNNVGGQDDLIFDGGSMVINPIGNITHFAGFFNETLLPIAIDTAATNISSTLPSLDVPDTNARIYSGLTMALRDYIHKNHFNGVIIGLSGGIDSALTLAIAVDALGKNRVRAVAMPSRYTAAMSNEDAAIMAENLGVKLDVLPIEDSFNSFLETLNPVFQDNKMDVASENIQARCRGIILMALSNKTGNLVLTTGNRSEMAVGYCTLYGDMAGGFAVLKDIPKTKVYELACYRNSFHPIIPQRIIDRPPSAELAPDQKDQDTLPPYSILDGILEGYLNQGQSIDELIASGFSRETVIHIIGLIRKSEYKRKQSALGPRINHKSFGKDWRYPVTNGFKG